MLLFLKFSLQRSDMLKLMIVDYLTTLQCSAGKLCGCYLTRIILKIVSDKVTHRVAAALPDGSRPPSRVMHPLKLLRCDLRGDKELDGMTSKFTRSQFCQTCRASPIHAGHVSMSQQGKKNSLIHIGVSTKCHFSSTWMPNHIWNIWVLRSEVNLLSSLSWSSGCSWAVVLWCGGSSIFLLGGLMPWMCVGAMGGVLGLQGHTRKIVNSK